MCELLGMSANVPTDIRFSFAGLARRGGETGPHADGWGIGFYEGRGCRTFHDPEPSARSDLARLLRAYPIKSRIVVAHVRRANRGRVALENTHPFGRELWGPAVELRPQRPARRGQAPAARPPSPDRHHRQRTRLLLAARPNSRSVGATLPTPRAGSTGCCRRCSSELGDARRLQCAALRRADALCPLRQAAVADHPAGALRSGDAARRGSAGRLLGRDDAERRRLGGGDAAADPRRGVAGTGAGRDAGAARRRGLRPCRPSPRAVVNEESSVDDGRASSRPSQAHTLR